MGMQMADMKRLSIFRPYDQRSSDIWRLSEAVPALLTEYKTVCLDMQP